MDNNKLYRTASRIFSEFISHNSRTAGKIEFVKDSGPIRRDIRARNFDWSPESLRNLAKILWSAQRAHSYAITALRVFSKMPSSQFSPDGLLGGRGYIQQVKDMRSSLSASVEALSSFTDTIHDEINADHWSNIDDPDSDSLISDTEQVKSDPEEFVSGEMEKSEGVDLNNPSDDDMNPEPPDDPDLGDGDGDDGDDGDGFAQFSALKSLTKKEPVHSELPTDISDQKEALSVSEMVMRTVTPDRGNYSSKMKVAGGNSSLPLGSIPGPRVTDISPGSTHDGCFNETEDTGDFNLSNGTQLSNPIFNDWCSDGTSGYEDPTVGDNSRFKMSNYSLLPGSKNEKPMPCYSLGLSDQELDWMRNNDKPGVVNTEKQDFDFDLWEEER